VCACECEASIDINQQSNTDNIPAIERHATTPALMLTLRPLADDVPEAVRVRRALKALLRVYRLRCVRIAYAEARQINGDAAEGSQTTSSPGQHNERGKLTPAASTGGDAIERTGSGRKQRHDAASVTVTVTEL
jgi:hypothetical protein